MASLAFSIDLLEIIVDLPAFVKEIAHETGASEEQVAQVILDIISPLKYND
jgi:hypothetical protein